MTTNESVVDPTEVPLESPVRAELRRVPSLVIVNTGDGKGKSSSAFGVMLRAVSRGWKVAVVQYLKSGSWNTGEEKIGRQLGVDWWAIGDGFTWDSTDLDETEAIAREAWASSKAHIQSGEHQLVILDEITYPMNWGWISTDDVVSTIANRPVSVNVICTGRNAPQALIDIADTVTEMVKVKHAFEAGIAAKKGIEY
jgi:cob(I)alamin adenosyltransferase